MSLLRTIGLLLFIGGIIGSVQGGDAPPDAPPAEPPAVATNPVAEQMAITPALYEQKYLSLQLDLIFFNPITQLPPFAIRDPNNNTIQEGSQLASQFDQDNNIRPVLQYHCNETNTLFEINYLRISQGNNINQQPFGGRYWAPLATPDSGVDFSTSIEGKVSLNYIEFNILARHSIRRTDTMNFFIDWGFRWVQIRQRLRVDYVGVNGGGGTEVVDVRSAVSAGGLAFGAGVEYGFWSYFTLHGRFGMALLEGSLSGSYLDQAGGGGGTSAEFTRNETQLVPGLEAAAGIDFNPNLDIGYGGLVIFHAGYEMKNYFQVTDTSTIVDDVGDGSILSRRSSFGTAGYVLGIQFVWTLN